MSIDYLDFQPQYTRANIPIYHTKTKTTGELSVQSTPTPVFRQLKKTCLGRIFEASCNAIPKHGSPSNTDKTPGYAKQDSSSHSNQNIQFKSAHTKSQTKSALIIPRPRPRRNNKLGHNAQLPLQFTVTGIRDVADIMQHCTEYTKYTNHPQVTNPSPEGNATGTSLNLALVNRAPSPQNVTS